MAEAIDHALCKRIEGERIESACMVSVAPRANPRREIGRRVPFEADREDALGCRRRPGLEQIGRALSEEVGLARARSGVERADLELVYANRLPIFSPHPARQYYSGIEKTLSKKN